MPTQSLGFPGPSAKVTLTGSPIAEISLPTVRLTGGGVCAAMRAEKFPRPSAGFCNCQSGAVFVPVLSQNVLALAPLAGSSCSNNPTLPMLVTPVNSTAHVTEVTSSGTRTRRSLTVTML